MWTRHWTAQYGSHWPSNLLGGDGPTSVYVAAGPALSFAAIDTMAAKLITALGGARLRDGLLLVAGLALSFLIMAYRGRIPHGALWGGLGVILALVATLRWMGLLAPLSEEQRTSLPSLWQTCFAPLPGERSWFAPQWAVPLAVLLVGVGLVFPSWLL